MEVPRTYENFPFRIVFLSNLVSGLIYISGFIITFRLHWIVAAIYVAYLLVLELRLLSQHCTACYYWGKTCGFGKGRISRVFFKKGDPSKFCGDNMSWKEMIPDLLITLIPLVIGIVLLIHSFEILLLSAVVLLIVLTTSGNGYIRGNLTCKYCKQRETGCPAYKLFNS
jgi:hypothetical protein